MKCLVKRWSNRGTHNFVGIDSYGIEEFSTTTFVEAEVNSHCVNIGVATDIQGGDNQVIALSHDLILQLAKNILELYPVTGVGFMNVAVPVDYKEIENKVDELTEDERRAAADKEAYFHRDRLLNLRGPSLTYDNIFALFSREEIDSMQSENLIPAIQSYRLRTGASLKASKDLIHAANSAYKEFQLSREDTDVETLSNPIPPIGSLEASSRDGGSKYPSSILPLQHEEPAGRPGFSEGELKGMLATAQQNLHKPNGHR